MNSLDYSLTGLFPGRENPENDPKCVVSMKIIQEFNRKGCFPNDMSQQLLQTYAEERYNFISLPGRLSLPDADHTAFLLYQKGLSPNTAKEYVSFRLTDDDKKKWVIVVK